MSEITTSGEPKTAEPEKPGPRPYLNRFRHPYQRPLDERDDEFNDRTGVEALALRALRDEIDRDIGRMGVSWWVSTLSRQERVHISDHLVECVDAVIVRLADARLHAFELHELVEAENRIMVQRFRDSESDGLPDRVMPLDEVPGRLARLHVVGVLHSIQAALDCLGGAIVGVAGLRAPIRTADLHRAERAYRRPRPAASVDALPFGHQFQLWLADEVDRVLRDAGPLGWRVWSERIRNGYAHRPDPLMVYGDVRVIRVVENQVVAGVQIVPRLPGEPDFGQLEAFETGQFNPICEDSRMTLDGLIASANQSAELVASALKIFWETRRAHPTLIEQPAEQWCNPVVTGFSGYCPTPAINTDSLTVSPNNYRRLVRAEIGKP